MTTRAWTIRPSSPVITRPPRPAAAQAPGPLLVLHDTTEFSFQRSTPDGIGSLSLIKGRHATHTVCGVLLHSSLVVTAAGLPLGLAATRFWTRKAFKGTNARKKRINSVTRGSD